MHFLKPFYSLTACLFTVTRQYNQNRSTHTQSVSRCSYIFLFLQTLIHRVRYRNFNSPMAEFCRKFTVRRIIITEPTLGTNIHKWRGFKTSFLKKMPIGSPISAKPSVSHRSPSRIKACVGRSTGQKQKDNKTKLNNHLFYLPFFFLA